MKKFSFLILLCVSVLSFAQQDINESFGQQMATMFAPLDKSKVPNGLLLDIAMEFTDVPRFNGTLTDSTYIRPSTLKGIYNTLLMSRVRNVNEGIVSPEVFENNWFAQRNEAEIALSGLYFKYSKFADNALTANKLTYSNNQFSDKYVGGVWQNPYQEMKTFAISAPVMAYTGQTLKVKLPATIFYSNAASEIQKIEMDAGDGLGFRPLPYDQAISFTYPIDGEKIWKYRLTLSNGQMLLSHSKIWVRKGLRMTEAIGDRSSRNSSTWASCNAANTDVYYKDMVSSQSFGGRVAKARIFIDDAGGDCKITKPLIVVEGWDVSTLLNPESKYSSEDYEDFLKTINDSYSMQLGGLLVGAPDIAHDQEYDIIYVNWDNGMDDIQRNALVVEDIIKWVNNIKEGTEKIAFIGQSMGGVVGRYAIKDLEDQGYTHNIRLFVSHDSPQQGANIPLSIQYMYRNMSRMVMRAPGYWIFDALSHIPLLNIDNPLPNYMSILDQPATKQMLMNRVDMNYNLDNSTHNSFYAMLDAKGYPAQNGIRNIAISNGSECGQHQVFNEGDYLIKADGKAYTQMFGDVLGVVILPVFNGLMTTLVSPSFSGAWFLSILPGNSRYEGKLYCNALYQNPGNQIYEFRLTYYKKILWVIPSQSTIFHTRKNQPAGLNLNYDNYGGGYINISDYAGQINTSGSGHSFLLGGYNYSIQVKDRFTLVPTPSALGIKATVDNDYERSYAGGSPPTAPLNTPFANFTTAYSNPTDVSNNNETHISFSARNGNWLAAELGSPNQQPYTTNCSFLCGNIKIEGAENFCETSQYVAPAGFSNYQWSIEDGNPAIQIVGTGNSIQLNNIGNFTGTIKLIVSFGNDCISSLSKSISVGVPQFQHFEYVNDLAAIQCLAPMGQLNLSLPTNKVKAVFSGLSSTEINDPSNWEWQRGNSLIMLSPTNKANTFNICPLDTGISSYRVRVKNGCGWSEWIDSELFEITATNPQNNFKILNNPVKDILKLGLNNTGPIQKFTNSKAIIYDGLGNLKGQFSIRDLRTDYNVSNLLPGVYYLEIRSDERTERITFLKN